MEMCTCCVVFMVVYDIRYGSEGVLFGQEELSGVCLFDLVMPDFSTRAARTKCQFTDHKLMYILYHIILSLGVNYLDVLV